MLEALIVIVCLAILVAGSITDFRWREVPDWISFAGISAGLGIRAIHSAATTDWTHLLSGIYGLAATFLLACALFYLGQWGGGDSKLLMALGALLGLDFSWNNLLLAFLAWTVLVGAFYGLGWSVVLGIKHKRAVSPALHNALNALRPYRVMTWVVAGILAVTAFLIRDVFLSVMVFALAVIVPLLFFATVFVKTIEQCCMLERVTPDKLTEGDWIAKNVVVKGKRIAGPKDLGVTKKQIAQLKKLYEQNKIKKVLVKQGIPFIPALLIAFVLALVFGNVIRFFFG